MQKRSDKLHTGIQVGEFVEEDEGKSTSDVFKNLLQGFFFYLCVFFLILLQTVQLLCKANVIVSRNTDFLY